MRQLFMLFMLLQTAVIYAGTPAQLTITLASEQSTYLLGEPVILECSLENKGEAPLVVVCNLSFPFTPCALHINGPIRKNCVEPRGQYEIGAYTTPPPLMAHEIRRLPPITASVLGVVCAGDYDFWIEYDATTLGAAPLRARLTPIRAESNHVHVRLVRPTGIDAKIFTKHANACNQLNLKSNVLLEKYPTSTYAGYVIYEQMRGFGKGNQNMFLRSIETGSYLSNSYPDDTGKSKDGWRSLSGEQAAQWWSKWINIILANHPDIWFADQLRLKRAVDQVALKNYQAGASDLEALSKEATPEVAQKAKDILGMMRTKGWIKNEPPKTR